MLKMPLLRPTLSLKMRIEPKTQQKHYYACNIITDQSEAVDQKHFLILKLWHEKQSETTIDEFLNYAASNGHEFTQEDVIETIHLFSHYIKHSKTDTKKQQFNITDKINHQLNKYLMNTFPLFNCRKFVDNTFGSVNWLFSRTGIVVGILLFLIGFWLVLPNLNQLYADVATSFISLPLGIFFLIATFLISKLCHEMGHAYMAKKYGVTIRCLGIKLFAIIPMFYIDTEDFRTRLSTRKQIHIYLAGLLGELYFSIICLIAWLLLSSGLIKLVCAYQIGVILPLSILFNLRPAGGTDGARALAATLDMERIETKSIHLIKNQFYKALFNTYVPITLRKNYPLSFFILNGISSMLFVIVGWLLITAVAINFLPIEIAITISLLMFYMGIATPLANEIVKIKNMIKHIKINKLLFLTATIAAVVFVMLPTTLQIPITAFYQPTSITTPNVTSVVQEISWKSGAELNKSDLIIKLQSSQLQQNIVNLNSENQVITQKLYYEIATHTIDLQPAIEQLTQNKILLENAEKTDDALTIHAPANGIVEFTQNLHPGRVIKPETTIATFYRTSQPYVVGFLSRKQLNLIEANHINSASIVIDGHKIKALISNFTQLRSPIPQTNWLSRHIISVGGTIPATVISNEINTKNHMYTANITPLGKLPLLSHITNATLDIALPSWIIRSA